MGLVHHLYIHVQMPCHSSGVSICFPSSSLVVTVINHSNPKYTDMIEPLQV